MRIVNNISAMNTNRVLGATDNAMGKPWRNSLPVYGLTGRRTTRRAAISEKREPRSADETSDP